MTLFSIDNVLCPLKLESTIFLKSFALCPKGYSIFYMPKIYEGESNGTPLQYSCLENPMDGGAWWATVHEVTKSWTQLSDFTLSLGSSHCLILHVSPWYSFLQDTEDFDSD